MRRLEPDRGGGEEGRKTREKQGRGWMGPGRAGWCVTDAERGGLFRVNASGSDRIWERLGQTGQAVDYRRRPCAYPRDLGLSRARAPCLDRKSRVSHHMSHLGADGGGGDRRIWR